jgi:hypothetical protein
MSCTDQDIGKLLGSYELDLLSEEERRQFENHLLECETCFQSLYHGAPIANLIREGKLAPSQSVKLQDDKEKAPIRFFSRKWALAAASVLVVMIIAFVFVWVQGPRKKTNRLRGHDDVSILVVSPVGEVTAPTELKWKPISGADLYEVKLYNEAGDLVWEDSVQGDTAVLPESLQESLIPGQVYTWQVEAFWQRERIKSQLIRFQISR